MAALVCNLRVCRGRVMRWATPLIWVAALLILFVCPDGRANGSDGTCERGDLGGEAQGDADCSSQRGDPSGMRVCEVERNIDYPSDPTTGEISFSRDVPTSDA